MTRKNGKSSYTSQSSWLEIVRQSLYSYTVHSSDIPAKVAQSISDAEQVSSRLKQKYGHELENLEMLEIGPGQHLSQMVFFSRKNVVIGIDLDVIAYSSSMIDYFKMLRINGIRRTAKTLGRKLLRIDARYKAELFKQLELTERPNLQVRQMDASRMDFANEIFDCVYSRAVFHHLPDPGQAMAEIVRVLRPGGLVYIALHPYTNPNGCLDPRLLVGDSEILGMWPHLRPEAKHLVRPNAFLNKLPIAEWQRLFDVHMPKVSFVLSPCPPEQREAACRLHQQGVLTDFSVLELTTGELVAVWQKPTGQL